MSWCGKFEKASSASLVLEISSFSPVQVSDERLVAKTAQSLHMKGTRAMMLVRKSDDEHASRLSSIFATGEL